MIRRCVTLAAVVMVALLGGALPASAHDQLIGSTPAHDSVLEAAPAQIELEYNAEIIDAAAAILIQDDAGVTVHEATPAVDGRFVRAAFPELVDGAYSLNWSVVSSDGHRIEGSISFTLAAGNTAEEPTASESSPTEETNAASDAATTTAEPQTSEAPTTAAPSGLGDLSAGTAVIVGVAGIGAAGAIAALLIRRWRATREDT